MKKKYLVSRDQDVRNNVKISFSGLTLLFALLTAVSVNATNILSPDAVINNTLGKWHNTLSEDNMIDQSGLSIGFDSGVTDLDSYISLNPTHVANISGTVWASSSGATSGNVDFDLGSVFYVSDFVLWSDANQFGISSAIKNFNLYASLFGDFSSYISLGSFIGELGPQHPGSIPAQIFSFSLADARYIRLEILDHYGEVNVNIHEVAFGVELAPVPEPISMLLFGTGLVGVGGYVRKKLKK